MMLALVRLCTNCMFGTMELQGRCNWKEERHWLAPARQVIVNPLALTPRGLPGGPPLGFSTPNSAHQS